MLAATGSLWGHTGWSVTVISAVIADDRRIHGRGCIGIRPAVRDKNYQSNWNRRLGRLLTGNVQALLIREAIRIAGTHDLIIHSYGPSHRMATIHAEVPNDIDFEMAHETIDRIERDVLEQLDIFLVIHMDPIEMNDAMVIDKKNMVTEIIRNLDGKASIHDFRVVNGEHQINLIFDLVIPHAYTVDDEQRLLKQIIDEVRNGIRIIALLPGEQLYSGR